MINRVVILEAKRSAIAKFGGALQGLSAVEMGVSCLSHMLSQGSELKEIDNVIVGNVLSAGLGQNIARQIALGSGLAYSVPAFTVNQVCGSGLQALMLAAQSIKCGDADIVVAGGVESMSNAPYVLNQHRFGQKMGHDKLTDTLIQDGLWDAFNNYHMGITAENVAKKWQISRQEQDMFALASQQKASAAQKSGRFINEIIPIRIPSRKGDTVFEHDEYIRHESSFESLSSLKPAFDEQGSVTAGNASGINDGAAFLILASEQKAKALNLPILAFIDDFVSVGHDPAYMGVTPYIAIQKLLIKQQLTLSDIDLFELNEAFASQAIAIQKELNLDNMRLNVNGGAIALGHPIGASGARILVTLIHEMIKRDNRRGLASLCIGGGQANAVIISR